MASPQSPSTGFESPSAGGNSSSTRGEYSELSKESRNALALPPGKKGFRQASGLSWLRNSGSTRNIRGSCGVRGKATRGRECGLSENAGKTWPAVRFYAAEAGPDPTPHTGKGTPKTLNRAGREGGWCIKLVTQPAHSPDFNINDLGGFASLKSRVWGEHFGTIDALVEGVKSMYDAYDAETLERVWRRLFKRYNQVLKAKEGKDFEVEHTGTIKRQREGGLAKRVPVDEEAAAAALGWWIDGTKE